VLIKFGEEEEEGLPIKRLEDEEESWLDLAL
jgi:hypothetical protein